MKKWLQTVLSAAILSLLPLSLSSQECDFKGFYIGGHGGFLSYAIDRTDLNLYFSGLTSYSVSETTWEAGLQLGYDWQRCNKLFGLSLEWSWTDGHPELKFDQAEQSISSRMHWFLTLRARAGLVMSHTLFYITAGGVLAELNSRFTNHLQTSPSLRIKRERWGGTVGFGSEFAFCKKWSINAEVLYLRIKSYKKSFVNDLNVEQFHFKFHDEAWVGRIGLNYHFSLCSLWGGV